MMEMVLFSGRMAYPLDSSTDYKAKGICKYLEVHTYKVRREASGKCRRRGQISIGRRIPFFISNGVARNLNLQKGKSKERERRGKMPP